jgi:flavorubredoxin
MFEIPDPVRVAEGTYMVRPLVRDVPDGTTDETFLHVNSMLILGAEPVLVDTGVVALREHWMEQTFALVDPEDVRWIFLSHADADHVGNLPAALDVCPNATVVTTWEAGEHSLPGIAVPADRHRHLADGDALELPDRRLVAVRPPVFDSPATRGLYDTSTGVYWSADAFGLRVPGLVDEVDDLPCEVWMTAADSFAATLSPWLEVTDPVRFGQWVDRVAGLAPTSIAGAHGPLLIGRAIEMAIVRMRELPGWLGPAGPRGPARATLDIVATTRTA